MYRISKLEIAVAVCLVGLTGGDAAGQDSPLVSVPLDLSGRRAVIEVSINGRGPFPVVVDAEFRGVRIKPELIEELGLPRNRRGARGRSRTGYRATLAIGDLEFPAVSVEPWDEDDLGMGGDEPQGRLGLSLFSDYLLTVDFPGRSLELLKGTLDSGEGVLDFSIETSPFDDSVDVPTIPALVAGKELELAIITGLFGELLLPTDLIESLPLTETPEPVGRIETEKGEAKILGSSLNGALEIAGHQIGSPGVFFSDILTRPGAAAETFFDFVLTFDQKNRRVRLLRDQGHLDHLNEEAVLVQNLTLQNVNLREVFNRDRGKVRMLLILSPT